MRGSSPSSAPASHPGYGQMAQPEPDPPPPCTLQPGGARVSWGGADTPGGHLLPPGQPAAPFLAALGRGSQGKLPPGSALHSPASGGTPHKSQRASNLWEGKLWTEQGRANTTGKEEQRWTKTKREKGTRQEGEKRRRTIRNNCRK